MRNSNSLILLPSLLIFLSLPSLNRATIRILVDTCHSSGFLIGKAGFCTTQNYANCCQTGQLYNQYRCSLPVTNTTNALLDVGGFSQGSDGGAPAECDGNYHDDTELVVALPTGWDDGGNPVLPVRKLLAWHVPTSMRMAALLRLERERKMSRKERRMRELEFRIV